MNKRNNSRIDLPESQNENLPQNKKIILGEIGINMQNVDFHYNEKGEKVITKFDLHSVSLISNYKINKGNEDNK